jgi:hypothetical protein
MPKYFFNSWSKCPKCNCRMKIHHGQYIISECQSIKCGYTNTVKKNKACLTINQ